MDYIIIQAGGKGKRLGYLTKNKPKALVPIMNLPMIFHLFRKYPDKKFIIIADYKKDVMRKYLAAFADVKYQIADANGSGTCAGVCKALELIPAGEKFMLIWSDLVLPKSFKLPIDYEEQGAAKRDYIGISGSFSCRWKYDGGRFEEVRSAEHGVAGLFLFRNKSVLEDVPLSGELVRWMHESGLKFGELDLSGTKEFGLIEEYENLEPQKSRPFNVISISGNILTKQAVDDQGLELAKRECAWYEQAGKYNISGIPKIYSTNPLKMEYINGRNIYECDFDYKTRKSILQKLVSTLVNLHNLGSKEADSFSMKEAYFNKTMRRLDKVRDLVPYATERYITVNDRKCRNIFYYRDELEKKLEQIKMEPFKFIHGDCTFSNLMISSEGEPYLIDPRGYFGYTDLYGDERYDWAKLYYSLVGNYDKFNLGKFKLDIGGQSIVDEEIIKDLDSGQIRLQITSNGWEDLEQDFFEMTGANPYEIKLLHAIIWLSLTTYAWQDYDSVCGAFYNGLYYLEEVL